jgi:uncharacterized protein (DUF1697 family)
VVVALLRAVNVGGTSILPMKQLSALCADLGFDKVRTYIQSGNVVFESARPEDAIRASLEGALEKHMGKKVDVFVRGADELRRILEANPFPDASGSQVIVLFCDSAVPESVVRDAVAPDGEQLVLGRRELYIHYPNGMGRSRLKMPTKGIVGTARNLNTVAKLVAMTSG